MNQTLSFHSFHTLYYRKSFIGVSVLFMQFHTLSNSAH